MAAKLAGRDGSEGGLRAELQGGLQARLGQRPRPLWASAQEVEMAWEQGKQSWYYALGLIRGAAAASAAALPLRGHHREDREVRVVVASCTGEGVVELAWCSFDSDDTMHGQEQSL